MPMGGKVLMSLLMSLFSYLQNVPHNMKSLTKSSFWWINDDIRGNPIDVSGTHLEDIGQDRIMILQGGRWGDQREVID
jgi:hypothetical protein